MSGTWCLVTASLIIIISGTDCILLLVYKKSFMALLTKEPSTFSVSEMHSVTHEVRSHKERDEKHRYQPEGSVYAVPVLDAASCLLGAGTALTEGHSTTSRRPTARLRAPGAQPPRFTDLYQLPRASPRMAASKSEACRLRSGVGAVGPSERKVRGPWVASTPCNRPRPAGTACDCKDEGNRNRCPSRPF